MLLILDKPETPSHKEVRRSQRLMQILSDRVFTIEEPDAERLAELAELPGISLYREGAALAQIPDDLSATERLWVDAWGQRGEQKDRPGEGLSWDAPGFEPPDPPHGQST